MVVSKRHLTKITDFTKGEYFAAVLKQLTIKYDNLLKPHFLFIGIHQAPTDGEEHLEWQFHMHFTLHYYALHRKKIYGRI
jgi:UDPglucose--hexose-1-phosphate uridylyltransferase